jgi:hypothetical protein
VGGTHPLGAFHGAPHLPMQLALLGTAALVTFLGRLLLAGRARAAATWWASNARDLVNLFAVAAFAVALLGLGFPVAAALLLSAQGVLFTVAVEAVLERFPAIPSHDGLALLAALLWTLPVALAPQQIFLALEAGCRLLAR